MTTDLDLRSALEQDAAGTGGGAGWDDVVRRGRRRQRVQRARTGLLGVFAVVAVGGAVSLLNRHDPDPTVTVNDPKVTTTTAPATTTTAAAVDPGTLPADGPQLFAARVQGAFVTVVTVAADPPAGFDPCTARHPRVVESPDQVGIELVDASIDGGQQWAACQAGAFTGWGTIELTDPLGDRQLVDLTTGNVLAPVDGAPLLFPTTLPAAFDLDHWDEFASDIVGQVENSPAPDGWTFSWDYNDEVISVATDVPITSGCDLQPITVRGIDGEHCGASFLVWSEGGHRHTIEMANVGAEPLSLSLDDLLAVAEGLEPLGG